MNIFGIAGTNGSGKDTVSEFLVKEGYYFVSVSDLLREEAKKRGLAIERENLRSISAEWRRKFGLGILVDKAVELFDAQNNKYKGLVVTPMRNVGEAERVHQLGGKLIWVDADPKIRYSRISRRGRSSEDNKTYEDFLREEEDEMFQSGDEATLNSAGVKAISDIFLVNNFSKIDQFEQKIEQTLANE